ncbi:hypothetical protein F5Y03DRAFT_315652 [Xylaria venustula]|nr:hypothetical protein F5Y03DRAFT_315652 [Xylaria venustula]
MYPRLFTLPSPPAVRLPARIASYNYKTTELHHDEAVPLVGLDPETDQFLHRQHRPRRVRIQGRLANVRTVSVANIGQAKNCTPIAPTDVNCEYSESENEGQGDDNDAVEGDAQFRGYGIGGAGNIRRPTEVMGASSSASASLLSLIHASSHSLTTSSSTTKTAKLRSRMAGLIHGLRSYTRKKGIARGA